MSKRIFFIAGMHRSGTSFLAKTLSFMGLELPGSIQPGAQDNPKGHFESFEIARYHDSLLNELSSSWDTFIPPPDSWFSSEYAERSKQYLAAKILSEFPGDGPIVLKDPRLSLFFPLWMDVANEMGLQDFSIIPIRHPSGVAASLDKRNKTGRSRSYLIWLNYLFHAEKHTRGRKRSFVHFPSWCLELELTIDEIERDLGTGFPKKTKKNIALAKKEFERGLVHFMDAQSDIAHNDMEILCFETFRSFLKLKKDSANVETMNEIDGLRQRFEKLSSVYAEVFFELELQKEVELEKLLVARQTEEAQVSALQQQLDESAGRVTNLQVELQNCQAVGAQTAAQASALQQQLDESAGRVRNLEAELRVEVASTTVLRSEINEQKVQNRTMEKEYGQLMLKYRKEQLTVIRSIYRNFYIKSGLILRKTLPITWVESIKKIALDPNGVPNQLTYQPKIPKDNAVDTVDFLPPTMSAMPDIFVLSIINWDFRYQRPQHIAKELADSGRRVFYIEMELAASGDQLTEISANLYRVRLSSNATGYVKPYIGQINMEQAAAWVNAFYEFCNMIKSTSFKHIVIQHPYWWQFARHLSPEFEITFDCMDDISGFSNTEDFLLNLEQDMLQKCDRLVVSSQYLFDKYKHFKTPNLVRNGAELEHFDYKAKDISTPSFLKPADSKEDVQNTIEIGYVGAIAEWFDPDLIKAAAEIDSNFKFHLCGEVTTQDAAQLSSIANINMYGEIPYSEVPGFLNKMDVMIIPFKLVPIIQACDPVKFYEYSAMGKPTVTTALPELARASELTFVASTPTEFAEQIHNACEAGKKSDFRQQLQEYAADNTWKHRKAQIESVLGNSPGVSIVILSYGAPELTKAALHSLYDGGSTYPNQEVLVVDNGSPPAALDEIRKFVANYPDATVIENAENLGFAEGNNVGLTAATGDYVMLLNNDTVVTPGAINAMVRHLEHNPSIGVVGPLTNNIGNEAKLFVEYEDMVQMRDVARQATTGYRGIFESINVTAYFAAMFRRSDLDIFGMLPGGYGRGMFEDDDHCAMIKSQGYICALAEDAYVHHHLSATFSKLEGGEKEALFEQNKKTYEKKWGDWKAHKYRDKRPLSSLVTRVK